VRKAIPFPFVMSRRLRVASDVAPGSPMPRPGLPGPPAGLPDYSGGHAGTGKMLTLSPSPVKREQSPRVLDARNNASTSFAKSLYGPQFWRTWEKEAVVGSDMAMSRVIADDHEEQVSVLWFVRWALPFQTPFTVDSRYATASPSTKSKKERWIV
jgi:hypothetical protein